MAAIHRIGIYGGTFDPIHIAHLAIAEEARWALDLQRVIFVPAARQPFKGEATAADPEHRLTMTRLACAANPAFAASAIDIQRPPPSYTVETLTAFRARFGAQVDLTFILGADAARDLPRWHRAAELLTLARFAVIGRPGVTVDLALLEAELPGVTDRLTVISGPQLAIASTELRQRLATGQPVRYQIPEPVCAYIHAHGLYGSAAVAPRADLPQHHE
jgi:nicotinate-nucleotide adenylyltransferase